MSGVFPQVRPLVEAALAKQPGQRPSAPDLPGRLAAATAPGADPALGPTQTALARTWLPPAGELPSAGPEPSRPGKRFLPVLLAVAVAAALAGTALAFLTQPSANPRAATGDTRPPPARPPAATQTASASSVRASPPSGSSSAASASQALGGIAAGTQNCAYSSDDGTYLATVEVTHSV